MLRCPIIFSRGRGCGTSGTACSPMPWAIRNQDRWSHQSERTADGWSRIPRFPRGAGTDAGIGKRPYRSSGTFESFPRALRPKSFLNRITQIEETWLEAMPQILKFIWKFVERLDVFRALWRCVSFIWHDDDLTLLKLAPAPPVISTPTAPSSASPQPLLATPSPQLKITFENCTFDFSVHLGDEKLLSQLTSKPKPVKTIKALAKHSTSKTKRRS